MNGTSSRMDSYECCGLLARFQVPAHILMSFSTEQLNKWSAPLHQLDTRGAQPQAIDLIHKSLHRPLLTKLIEDGYMKEVPYSVAFSFLRDAMNAKWQLVIDTIKRRYTTRQ